MANQADGSIIIDTELNSDGFKAGSTELLAAIKALSEQIQTLGQTLTDIFSKPLTPEINTSGAESKVQELEAKVQELESELGSLQRNSGGAAATPQVDLGSVSGRTSGLQREINSVVSSVEKLEPTFQKALGGSESAITSFQTKSASLKSTIADLHDRLEALGNTQFPTEQYTELSAETEKAGQKLELLLNRQEKMQALGVKENSGQWKNLQYELDLASEKYDRLAAAKAQMESSGTAFQLGSDTAQYAQMESALEEASSRLSSMRLNARGVLSALGEVAKTAAGKLVSGIKSAATHMAKLLKHSKKTSNSFGGLISGAKRFALSLLGARGVWQILRKAVSAYMAQNQELTNKLSSCWTSIGNLLGPIITRVINLVAQAVSYVTSFLKLFGVFGKSTTAAISSAGGAASKETDKLKRELASFDELNILSDKDSDSGGGGGSSSAGALADAKLPDWATLMAEQIKAGNWSGAAATLTEQLNSLVAGADWAGMGTKIAYYLDGALTFIASAITGFDWFALGSNLATCINNIIDNVDWANLGIVLGAKFIILIEGLGGLFATLGWTSIGTALSDAFMGLWNAINWTQAATTVSNGLIGVLDAISAFIQGCDWQQIGNDVADFIAGIDWSGIASSLSKGIGSALGGFASLIWGLIEDAWDEVVDWWCDAAYEDGEFTMEGLLDGIWNAICDIGTWINEHIFQPFIDGFKSAFGIASPSKVMEEQGGYIISGLLQGITNAWSNITSFFSNALSTISSTISNAWSTVKSTTATTFSNVATTINTKISNIKNTVKTGFDTVKTSITTKMKNVMSTLKGMDWGSIGTNICTGIKNGITNGWNALKQKVSGLASGLLESAKSILGIHSPSRVFRDEVGLNIGYGIGEGIEDSQSSVLQSVSGVADAIADEFSAGDYQLGTASSSGLNGVLTTFSDKISDSFTSLMDRLQAIADNITFTMPTAASGIIPYQASTASAGNGYGANGYTSEELSSVIVQTVSSAAAAIVDAIQEYSGTTVNLDSGSLADSVVSEINRKTRMSGKSPLLI